MSWRLDFMSPSPPVFGRARHCRGEGGPLCHPPPWLSASPGSGSCARRLLPSDQPAVRRSPQWRPFRANGRTGCPSAKLVEQVSGGHDPYNASVLDHHQATDCSSSHQIGGLPERGRRTGAHGIGGHQITNGAVTPRCRSSCAAKIAFGDNANEAFALHDDEMTDAVPAHRGPRNARGIVGFNGDHVNAHDIS
jgi:hypothetical protein